MSLPRKQGPRRFAPARWLLLAALAGCQSSKLPAGVRGLEYEGNRAFAAPELDDVVAREFLASETTELSPTAVDDAAFALELFYRKQGYPEVIVEYLRLEDDAGAARARFLVAEGVQVLIESLTLEGARSYGNDELSPLIAEMQSGQPWVESRVSAGAQALANFYYGHGFLKARVEGTSELNEEGTAAGVKFVIQEGPRFRVTDIVLDGDAGPKAGALGRLEHRYEGRIYTPRLAYEIRAALVDVFGRTGFPDADAPFETTIDETSGDVTLTFDLQPGEEVRVVGVVLEGNERTASAFIKRRLDLPLGKPWDSRVVRGAFRSLWSTGLFRSVEIELEQKEGPERDLRVKLEEAPSLELYVEPGWGSYEGPRLRTGLDERNLFGTGRRGFFETSVSLRAQSAEIGLDDPWFLGTSLRAESSIFGNHREEPSFTTEELGFRFTLRKAWNEELASTVGYEFRLTRLTDADVEGDVPVEALQDFDVATIQLSLVRDTRDNVLIPRGGGRSRLQFEWAARALGSEIEFAGVDLDLNRTYSVGTSVLAFSARAGATAPYGDTNVLPIQERRFNGGENSVRAFAEDDLGPVDAQGDPLGGEAFTVVSGELRRPLVGNLEYALFVDTGNVSPQAGDWFAFEDFRTGLGVGLRYLLPIGPLRIDLGYNPNARGEEDDFVLHFAVGLPF